MSTAAAAAALTPGRVEIVRRAPKRNDDRVILHFDYDCFYASVFENLNPSLKGLPLGVKQKSILATCNYAARARGVKKLMLVSEAQRACPDLVIVCGEDLTPFRDASKKLWSALRAHSWNGRVERLGLDEVFLDVTDVVAYNQELLNRNALRDSFFHLSRQDPENGFSFDGGRFFGCVQPPIDPRNDASDLLDNPLCVRLMLASHLAGHLRHKLEENFGYTSSGGISTNKVLAKLVGSANKPKNQTTLLSLREDDVQNFIDGHKLRQIPGIGSRIAQLIQDHVLSAANNPDSAADPGDQTPIRNEITTREVRQHPSMSPELLSQILDCPGLERSSGDKIWALLHGVDVSEVKAASDIPTQISIEDTYMARPLNTPAEVTRELRALSTSLVRRMRADLVVDASQQRWAAYPKTLRLSTRARPKPGSAAPESFSRCSRSQALPSFALSLRDGTDAVAERLAAECLLPLFRRLHPERQGYNLALINICVTNMAVVAGSADESGGAGAGAGAGGRDIARMFRTQEDKLREWTVYDTSPVSVPTPAIVSDDINATPPTADVESPTEEDTGSWIEKWVEQEEEGSGEAAARKPAAAISSDPPDADAWGDGDEIQRCRLCGHAIPIFAVSAHERFHTVGD
ncbi:hypothetical protein AAE478_005937 [Parahypoxylon ruwenzoriense]